jgi:hypothetical protein
MNRSPCKGESPLTVCNSDWSNETCRTAAVLLPLCAIVLLVALQYVDKVCLFIRGLGTGGAVDDLEP